MKHYYAVVKCDKCGQIQVIMSKKLKCRRCEKSTSKPYVYKVFSNPLVACDFCQSIKDHLYNKKRPIWEFR